MIRFIARKSVLAVPFTAAVLAASPAAAEDSATGFDLEGSIRVRYEAMDGNYRPGGIENDDIVLMRSLLKGTYSWDGFRVGATVQDSRGYANDLTTPIGSSDINALEVIELYAALDITETTTFTIGRQTLNLGSKRLIGNPNFRNAANGFTGARLDWSGSGEFTAFYMLPQQRLPSDAASVIDNEVEWDRESIDLALWGAFYSRPLTDDLALETYVYVLDEDDAPGIATRNRHLITPGARLVSDGGRGKPDVELEAAYQFGNIRTGSSATAPEVDVDAWTLHAEVGYTFDSDMKPRLSAFYDMATGDDPDSADYNAFDPLFGPRYGDWGPSGLFGPLGRKNISSLGAQLEAKFSSRVDAQVQYRRAWLEEATDAFSYTKVRDATGASGSDAGSQLQGRLRWWIIPGLLRNELGGGVLFKGDFFDTAPNANGFGNTQYGYSALELSF
ncbi:alginate export family protein [Aurantiacibacter flavus]|uniref:Alginate export family protein n=1 Tax=Aurantiacibacter flavus TaxID=3145232 RepID=A0ABV0CYW8_9SPHN